MGLGKEVGTKFFLSGNGFVQGKLSPAYHWKGIFSGWMHCLFLVVHDSVSFTSQSYFFEVFFLGLWSVVKRYPSIFAKEIVGLGLTGWDSMTDMRWAGKVIVIGLGWGSDGHLILNNLYKAMNNLLLFHIPESNQKKNVKVDHFIMI